MTQQRQEIRTLADEVKVAADRERAAWAQFNAALAPANAELAQGQFVSWAGEKAVRWIPGNEPAERVEARDTFLIGGIADEAARANPPRSVAEIAERHRLAPLMEACESANSLYNGALKALVLAQCGTPRELIEKAAALVALVPEEIYSEELICQADAVVRSFAADLFGVDGMMPEHIEVVEPGRMIFHASTTQQPPALS